MTSINNVSLAQTLTGHGINKGSGNPFAFVVSIPRRVLGTLYAWQNWANDNPQSLSQSDMPFRDIGPSNGSKATDYGKPIWRR